MKKFWFFVILCSFIQLSTQTDYIKFTEKCIVEKTQKEGIHTFLKDCASIVKELIEGVPFPRVCEEDTICKNVVCCHQTKPLDEYESNIPKELRKQIFLSPCGSDGKSGVFKPIDNCEKKNQIENIKPICKFDFCGEYVCCNEPKEVVPEVLKDTISNEMGKISIPKDWKVCYHHHNVFDGVVGEPCTIKATGGSGTCRDKAQCPYYKKMTASSHKENITLCGYESCLDIVCCPEIDFEKTVHVDHYCYANQNFAYETIRSPDYIDKTRCSRCVAPVGGEIASSKEYPYMAALGFQTVEPLILWNCGGSLVNNRYVITAAHCMESPQHGLVQYVRLGAINVYELPSETSKRPKDFGIEDWIPHPEYDPDYVYNDIGLLKLDKNVEFNVYIAPICLPSTYDIPDKNFVAAGWGSVGFSKPKTDWLIKVKLEQFTYEECNKSYGVDTGSTLKYGILDESQICAGSKTEVRDTCPGDSGGPLMIEHPIYYRRHLLIGVTSFGKTCGTVGSPGIYTRVFAYLDWINEIIWSN